MRVDDYPDDVRDLYAFVLQQLDRRIRLAWELGDELEHAFAQGSRRVVEGLEQHLADGVSAPAEVRRFLARAAHPRRHHPDFRFEWMLHADGFGTSPARAASGVPSPLGPDQGR